MQNDNPTSAVLHLWQQNLWRSALNHLTLPQQSYFEFIENTDITNGVIPINNEGRYWLAPIVAKRKLDNKYWIPLWIPVDIRNQTIYLSSQALPWIPYIQNEQIFGNAPLQGQMHRFDEWLTFEWLNDEHELAFETWQEAFDSIQALFKALDDIAWKENIKQQGFELCPHSVLIKEQIGEEITLCENSLASRYAMLTPVETKDILECNACYRQAHALCAVPFQRPLNMNAFSAAVHALLLEEGEMIAIKSPLAENRTAWIEALAHSKIASALLTKNALPTIWQLREGNCYAFCYELKRFNETDLQKIYSDYQSTWELGTAFSEALTLHEQVDESENDDSITDLQQKDERYEKILQRLGELQAELARKSQRKFLSWVLPTKKLNKADLAYFTKVLKLSTMPTQQELAKIISDKIRQLKISRTKIHRQLVDVVELKAASEGAKQRFEDWISTHLSTAIQEESFEGQVLSMQAYFAHQIYTLIFEKSSWELTKEASCDLLLLNESQHLLPQEAIPYLAKAKAAVFLGDNQDSIVLPMMSALTEEWELKRNGLGDEEIIEEMQFKGMLPSFGNAFSVALANSTYQELLEHGMQVSTLTLSQDDSSEKQYHAIAEHGVSQVRDNQLVNEEQAQFIVHWLETGPLTSQLAHVVIITPFVAQKELLCQKLAEHHLACEVFTFTELTDNQWQNVVFSPVYCLKDQRPFVFDQGENMLYRLSAHATKNVWIIGDLSIFDPRMHSPSGNLAKKLFQNETELIE